MTAISDHFGHHFGPAGEAAFHELVSDEVHLDVNIVPEEAYAELFILLPKDWEFDKLTSSDECTGRQKH